MIFMSINIFTGGQGGEDVRFSKMKNILQYNTLNHTWEEFGQMKVARHQHAAAVLMGVSQLCP